MTDHALTPSPQPVPSQPRTRRALLAGAAGSMAALLAARLGAPDRASAAAGDPLVLGVPNDAGVSNTTVKTNSSGVALQMNNLGTGVGGFMLSTGGTGLAAQTSHADKYGASATNQAPAGGAGGAILATGKSNHGLVATASGSQADAVRAVHTGTGIGVRATGDTGVEALGVTVGVNGGVHGTTAAEVGINGYSHSTAGTGVQGLAYAGTGTTVGVLGSAISSSGIGVKGIGTTGVRGESASSSGAGVRGVSTATTGNAAGVSATSASTGGVGVFGQVTATTSSVFGVFGETSSVPAGFGIAAGVWGLSGAGTGLAVGVFGQTQSIDDSAGVLGWAFVDEGTAAGVSGLTSSPDGVGVLGIAGPSPSIGVLGQGTGNGFGVYSDGRAHVQGTLDVTGTVTKGGGSFKIDHPLDPANKFLSHSFVESPDMKNIYDGVVKLDGAGTATVTLPDWFEALNRDVRYQLTPIGEYAPLFIRSKMKAGRFTIAGGEAGQEVSWQVTGIRKDAWAEAHRIPVEETKTGAVKGRYLHPKEHGQDAAKGIKSPAAARRAIAKAPKRPTPPA